MTRRLVIALLFIACGDDRGESSHKSLRASDWSDDVATVTTGGTNQTSSVVQRPSMRSGVRPKPTPADHDGDGLTDVEEVALGTNPTLEDTDHDALPDGWEVRGVNGIDLVSLGAKPRHRDIFVQMDVMTPDMPGRQFGPDGSVVLGITRAFANAPLDNPDGLPGIAIHLIPGPKPVAYDDLLQAVPKKIRAIKDQNFPRERYPVFRYMLWADSVAPGTTSGKTIAGIPGTDFIVALGAWNYSRGGNVDEKIGTFMHELGHTFGLLHSALGDKKSYEPNHLSVMNYLFQWRGVTVNGRALFTYQQVRTEALNESQVDEQMGVGTAPTLRELEVRWRNDVGELTAHGGGWIDWNQNRSRDVGPFDLNHDGDVDSWPAVENEWQRLAFDGGNVIGSHDDLDVLRKRVWDRSQSVRFDLSAELTFPEELHMFANAKMQLMLQAY